MDDRSNESLNLLVRGPRRNGRLVTAAFLAMSVLVALGGTCNPLTFPFGPPAGVNIPRPADPTIAALLAPVPKLPMGFYDYFGQIKTPGEARQLVIDAGLNPDLPSHYLRIGLIHLTPELIEKGRVLFNTQNLGDTFTLNNILSLSSVFGKNLFQIALDSFDPAADADGSLSFLRDLITTILVRPKIATTNLQVLLSRDLRLGTKVFPAGSFIDTGADVAAGALLPIGFGGNVSCALCHSSVDPVTGVELPGAPNTDLNMAFFIALTPNSAATFFKLNRSDFDPMDPKFPRTGRRILDSDGNTVQLPDPAALERAMDDFLLTVPVGSFDAGPDWTAGLTKIPDSWVFGEGGMGWDGGFNVGPFGGAAAFSNAVHSFEINFLSAANFSRTTKGLDPEIYLGVILQNAPDPALRIPDGVKPSQWLAERFPRAERDVVVELPTYPDPTLFSLNGLVFSPRGETFLESIIALAAFQSSLSVPPNRTMENLVNLQSGAVERGARVFMEAGCTDCHPPPYFTNRRIVSNDIVKANTARGKNRTVLKGLLVEAVLPSFDQPVPLPPNPPMITLPPNEFTTDNLTLPPGLDTPDGGYKVAGLLGLYLKAPYLHDAGVAVGPGALWINADGSYAVVDPGAVGVSGTTARHRPVSPAHSLRALLDRDLRAILESNNRADANVMRVNHEGAGHEFFVDPAAGFTYQQQTNLIAFLLALDDDPGGF